MNWKREVKESVSLINLSQGGDGGDNGPIADALAACFLFGGMGLGLALFYGCLIWRLWQAFTGQ